MGGNSAEAGFKALFFFFGVCLLIISLFFLPFVIQAHKARQQRQRVVMALKASDLGLHFDGKSDRHTAKKHLHLDQLHDLHGSDEYALNVISGDFQGASGHAIRFSLCNSWRMVVGTFLDDSQLR